MSTSAIALRAALVNIDAIVSFALESRGTFAPVRSLQVETGALTPRLPRAAVHLTFVDIDALVAFQFVALVALADVTSGQVHAPSAALVIGAFVDIFQFNSQLIGKLGNLESFVP